MDIKNGFFYIEEDSGEYFVFYTKNIEKYKARLPNNLKGRDIVFLEEYKEGNPDNIKDYLMSKFIYDGKKLSNQKGIKTINQIYEKTLEEFNILYPEISVREDQYSLLNICKHELDSDYSKIICPCGKNLIKKDRSAVYKTCSDECLYKYRDYSFLERIDKTQKQERTELTKLSRYGNRHYVNKDKRIKTCTEKYGDPFFNNYTQIKQTNKDRYGSEYLFQVDEVKIKSRESMLDKYGVEYAMQSPLFNTEECTLKRIQNQPEKRNCKAAVLSYKKKWNIDLKVLDTREKNESTIYLVLNPFGNDFEIDSWTLNNRTKHLKRVFSKIEDYDFLNPSINTIGSFSTSGFEKEVFSFVKDNYKGEILNNKKLFKKEIDIYLPDNNIGFECNGTYWHSSLQKEKNYHKVKSDFFKEKGIHIIHIWETDWVSKNDIIKSIIRNQLNNNLCKIYARKCIIKEISHTDTKIFLNQNHLQGNCISGIKLGLYYDNELVSVMTFGKLRKNLGQTHKEGYYELLRFCNKLNTSVVGGASKLFQYFIKNYNPLNIISYADKAWSCGNLYNKLNMECIDETEPGYFYVKSNIKFNRFQFRKSELIKEGYDPNKTEQEIMEDRGFYRIWDCGVLKYEYVANSLLK